jgi:hypothetical protein
MKPPDYLTRYYQKGEYPFLSLNDLPPEEANRVKLTHCKKNGIGDFYAQDDYLTHRRAIEKWIYDRLIELGGRPSDRVPVYMTLGESPEGKYDIRAEVQKNAEALRIPLREIDLSAVTFTYPDSMYEHTVDTDGNIVSSRRTNTPRVYTCEELPSVIEKYRIYENYRYNIEAQVWNREMLHEYWLNREQANDYK